MTNYEYLRSLTVEEFSEAIICIVNYCGGNSEVLLRELNSTYHNPHQTVREFLNENYSSATVSFQYRGYVYECVSVSDFIKKYGSVSDGVLDLCVKSVRTGRNGNKTIIL